MIDLSGISLATLIERDGVTLRGQAERYGPCPACGGRDRFHLHSYNGREYFFCRHCHDKRGDAIEYLRWLHGMTYGDALAALGLKGERRTRLAPPKPTPKTERGIVIPNCLDEPPADEWQNAMCAVVADCAANLPNAAREYLHGRGLTDDTIARHHIGYNADALRVGGEWWTWRGIVIPTIYGGHLWRVNVRRRSDDIDAALTHNAEVERTGTGKTWAEGKYIAATGSRAQLFNGDALAGAVHTVIVCAGEFDAMLAQQHAPDGVACITFGGETKRPTWEADYLLRDKRVMIAYDNDDAGEQGAQAWAAFGQRVYVPSGKDITEYFQAGGDVGAWIQSLLDDDLETLVLGSLARMGCVCSYGADGRIVAQREEVPA